MFGDTNSRYTRASDTALRTALRTQSGLTDAWVQLQKNGVNPTAGAAALLCDNPSKANDCETVDKLFYRGSSIVNLKASAFKYDSNNFLNTNPRYPGAILSDHNPTLTTLDWSVSSSLRQSGFSGGPSGNWFSSLPKLSATPAAASVITFRGAERLDSVGIKLADGTSFAYGGTGGTLVSLTLNAGERWTRTVLCTGQRNGETRNFYIQAVTSTGRTLQAGTKTSSCTTFNADPGFAVVGFMGQSGDTVDQLALIYGKY